jgi:hypothetical protein
MWVIIHPALSRYGFGHWMMLLVVIWPTGYIITDTDITNLQSNPCNVAPEIQLLQNNAVITLYVTVGASISGPWNHF